MKNKNWKNTAIIALGILAGSLGYARNAEAELNGRISFIKSEKENKSLVRTEASYELPQGVNGFTFMDFNEEEDYVGRSVFNGEVFPMLSLRGEISHSNQDPTNYGIGFTINSNIPNGSLSAYAIPFTFSRKDSFLRNETHTGYFISQRLPKGFSLSSFGEWDENNNWSYGEVKIGKGVGPTVVNYNPVLRSGDEEGFLPKKLEHRISMEFKF